MGRRLNLHGIADQIFLGDIHRCGRCGRALLRIDSLELRNDFNQRAFLNGQAGQVDGVGAVGIAGGVAGLVYTVGVQIPNGQAVDHAAGGSFLQPVAVSRGDAQNQLAVFQAALILNQIHTAVLAGVDANHVLRNPLRCGLSFALGGRRCGHRRSLLFHGNDGGAVGADVCYHGAVGADAYVAARNHLAGRIDIGFIIICGDAHSQRAVCLHGAGAGVGGRPLRFLSGAGLTGGTLVERCVEGNTAGALGRLWNDEHILALPVLHHRGRHRNAISVGVVGCQRTVRQQIPRGGIHGNQDLPTRVNLAHIQKQGADAAVVGIGGHSLSGSRASGCRIDKAVLCVVVPTRDEYIIVGHLVSGLSNVVLRTLLHTRVQFRLRDGLIVLTGFYIVSDPRLEGGVFCRRVSVRQADGDIHGIGLIGVRRGPIGVGFQRAGNTFVEQVGDALIGIHLHILLRPGFGAFLEGNLHGHIVGGHFKAVGAIRVLGDARAHGQHRVSGSAGVQILHGNGIHNVTSVTLSGEGDRAALNIIGIGCNRFTRGDRCQHIMTVGELAALKGIVLGARLEGGIRGQLVGVGGGGCRDRTVGGRGHIDLKLLAAHSLRHMQQLRGDSCLQLGLQGLQQAHYLIQRRLGAGGRLSLSPVGGAGALGDGRGGHTGIGGNGDVAAGGNVAAAGNGSVTILVGNLHGDEAAGVSADAAVGGLGAGFGAGLGAERHIAAHIHIGAAADTDVAVVHKNRHRDRQRQGAGGSLGFRLGLGLGAHAQVAARVDLSVVKPHRGLCDAHGHCQGHAHTGQCLIGHGHAQFGAGIRQDASDGGKGRAQQFDDGAADLDVQEIDAVIQRSQNVDQAAGLLHDGAHDDAAFGGSEGAVLDGDFCVGSEIEEAAAESAGLVGQIGGDRVGDLGSDAGGIQLVQRVAVIGLQKDAGGGDVSADLDGLALCRQVHAGDVQAAKPDGVAGDQQIGQQCVFRCPVRVQDFVPGFVDVVDKGSDFGIRQALQFHGGFVLQRIREALKAVGNQFDGFAGVVFQNQLREGAGNGVCIIFA